MKRKKLDPETLSNTTKLYTEWLKTIWILPNFSSYENLYFKLQCDSIQIYFNIIYLY